VWSQSSLGAATIPISEDATATVGAIIQPLFLVTEEDLDGDGNWDSKEDFVLRRARLRLRMDYAEWVSGFIQTDVGTTTDGAGVDARVIDAYVTLAPRKWAQFLMGEHMAPANRQNLTAASALMTIDRPGNSYKSLTWGTRSVIRFTTSTFEECDAGIRGDVDVRDTGATLFGVGSLREDVHWKYYLGAYDGIQADDSDEGRYTGRVQVNLGDPEPGYFNQSSYLGTKKTLGVGASYDTQADVAECPIKGKFDYSFYTLDVFAEAPLGPGSLTLEAAFLNLDLDDARPFALEDGTLSSANPLQSQGDGFYVQTGYLLGDWQPWFEFETWNADAEDSLGDYDMFRIGVTYFIDGWNANVKAGLEHVEADATIQGTSEDSLDTFALGTYISF
jgi:hypothetical protein